MKKMLICLGVLCMTLLALCGSALASDLKLDLKVTNADVVEVKEVQNGQFEVTKKSGVEQAQLYLTMIQEGAATEKAKPTKDNLYYLDVDEATGATFVKTAYPKDLDKSKTYVIYLSDYSGDSNGAPQAVATIAFVADSGDSGNSGDPGETKIIYGDVNGDGQVKGWDATVLANYLAGKKEYQDINMQNADCNGDGKVKGWDLTILYCYLAGQKAYSELPDNPHTGD